MQGQSNQPGATYPPANAPQTAPITPSSGPDNGAQSPSVADQVKDQVTKAADGQRGAIADQLDDLAQATHKSAQQFAGGQDWLASAIERGSTELSSLATSLRGNDINALLGQVQSFAQRQPAAYFGAAFAAGFALARVGKVVAGDLTSADLPKLPEVGHAKG